MSRKRIGGRVSLVLAALVALGLGLVISGCERRSDDKPGAAGHEGHDDHGADAHEDDAHEGRAPDGDAHEGDAHEGDAHEGDAHEGDAHEGGAHEGEDRVHLTPAQREQIGLTVSEAGPATLRHRAAFPGEVALSPGRVAHITPRAPGVVREVTKRLGDPVEADEILAWIESTELGQAKLRFFAKVSELRLYSIDVPRVQRIHESTSTLLALLEKMPSVEELHAAHPREIGEQHGRLVSAYAEFVFAQSAYAREKALHQKKISSEGDLLQAQNAFQKAQADYFAARDTISFETARTVLDTVRRQQVAEFEVAAAAQGIRILGLSEKDIEAFEALVPKMDPAGTNPTAPLATRLKQEKKLGWYPLRAPFAGTIIEKHITLGEKLGDDAQAYTVADLGQVWVLFHVYQKDVRLVRRGLGTRIEAGFGIPDGAGVVDYVAPFVEEVSRTALARVVLENPEGLWRPGLFVTVHVDTGATEVPIAIPRTAVQVLGKNTVVFIEEEGAFEPVPVTVGDTSDGLVEIKKGLKKGQRYVSKGAFELKAKLVTSALGSHAGHGH